MKLHLLAAVYIFVTQFLCSQALAHDGDHHPDMRVWTVVDDRVKIEGSFLIARDEQVQLLKHGGGTVWVPLEKLSETDRAWVRNRVEAIRRINGAGTQEHETSHPATPEPEGFANPFWAIATVFALALGSATLCTIARNKRSLVPVAAVLIVCVVGFVAVGQETKTKPVIQAHFEPFQDKLKFRSDAKYFYVESNGMPDHPMMIGITAWQQQVPMPQAYTGRNAWQIPLLPKLADKPVSAKKELFRGAIALAVNGVPIFNPIKNDGRTDTFLAGELDEFGGHCGRADDYHYHIAPIHLQKVVGQGQPIGYALDGYPLYGLTDADGKEPKDLDEFNGRMEKDGYRYYSTKKYPYVNGGLRGVVAVKDDQIDPQPRAFSPRPSLPPLRGAKITGFDRDDAKKTMTVKYEQNGKQGSVKYTANSDGYTFEFAKPDGTVTTEKYRNLDDGKRAPPPKKDGPPKKGDRPPPKKDDRPKDGFTLTSPAFDNNGKMPVEFTGDGEGSSPPLQWKNAPPGTKCFAHLLWHKPRADGDEVKSYWVISDIPANVTRLEKNSKDVGKAGINDMKRTEYDPMNSKGPGPKEYHITLYALSASPALPNGKFNRADLLKAIKDFTLAESTLNYTYDRQVR